MSCEIELINFNLLVFYLANVGALTGGVIYGLTYMPYIFLPENFSELSVPFNLFASLFSNIVMANGWNLVALAEGRGKNFVSVSFFLFLMLSSQFRINLNIFKYLQSLIFFSENQPVT